MPSNETQPVEPRPITVDSLPYGYISGLWQAFDSKVFHPDRGEADTARLIEARQQWREEGAVVVFTSGVFDLLHLDHAAYLLHVKATGASEHYARHGYAIQWDELDEDQQQSYTNWALSSGQVKLVVSVDGDKSVAARKGFDPQKGGQQRPIYGWQTRALMVASQSFIDPDPDGRGRLLPIADAVTIHGPDDFSDDNPHAIHFQLVEKLQPDVWTFFGESADIAEGAPRYAGIGNVALRMIRDGSGTHYYEDPFIGKMSTTKIGNRITGNI